MDLLPLGVHSAQLSLDLGDLGAVDCVRGAEAVKTDVKLEQAVRDLEQVSLDLLKCGQR